MENKTIEKMEQHPKHFKKLLRKMWEIRIFEETLEQLYAENKIHGTFHLCIGQEAAAVGTIACLRQEDWIASTHRNHGHSLAKGTSMRAMLAEILGKSTGINGGKGGSMHISDAKNHHLGSNGVVGGNFPIAAGAALSMKMQNKKQVVFCFAGEGATNEGSFHEALNLASIWQLPITFFIENNQYGMSSAFKKMTSIDSIAQRGSSYGIESLSIDGNDLVRVEQVSKRLVQRMRHGEGPFLVEAKTYRYKGHSKSDTCLYRSKEEEQRQQAYDPIRRVEANFIKSKIMNEADIFEEKQIIREKIWQLVQEVEGDPLPSDQELFANVYAK